MRSGIQRSRTSMLLGAVVALTFGIVALSVGAPASAKEKITIAWFFDRAQEANAYAVMNGKVTSDIVDLQFKPLNISALIQALGTRQYDIIETSTLGAVRAVQRGMDLKIIMGGIVASGGHILFTKKDSPFKTVADLKGKRVAVFSLGSTSVAHMRILVNKLYGLSIGEGGDVRWQEIPLTTIGTALFKGQLAAGYTIQSFARRMLDSGEYRVLIDVPKEWRKLTTGTYMPSIIVSYDRVIAKKAKLLREAQRMLYESSQYMLTHKQEIANALAKKQDRPAKGFLDWMEWNTITGELRDAQIKTVDTFFRMAKEVGIIKSYPPIESMVWRGYWEGK